MPKELSEAKLEVLRTWLNKQRISVNKLRRQFSDAVLLARLLKKFYPKLVDLHNYPPHNNTNLKLSNWERLNKKVLQKLGLQKSKATLVKLAKGTPGLIEVLLYDIMGQVQVIRHSHSHSKVEHEQVISANDQILVVYTNTTDKGVKKPQKMILFSLYDHLKRESELKDHYLIAAKQKIAFLENANELKSERIEELCQLLAQQALRNLLKESHLEYSSSTLLQLDHTGVSHLSTADTNTGHVDVI